MTNETNNKPSCPLDWDFDSSSVEISSGSEATSSQMDALVSDLRNQSSSSSPVEISSGSEATSSQMDALVSDLRNRRFGTSAVSLPPSTESNKRTFSSGGKTHTSLGDKGKGKGPLNGIDDVITTRKRPSYATYFSEDEVNNNDMQDFVARKRANASSSTRHKFAKISSSHMLGLEKNKDKGDRKRANIECTSKRKAPPLQAERFNKEDKDNGGPANDELIPSNAYHVAHFIWKGEDRGVMVCFGRSPSLKKWCVVNNEAMGMIRASGLAKLANTIYVDLDEPLLCAFIERWHPETNSFHMPWGEMTITLHDIYFLLGLPVAGLALIADCKNDNKSMAAMLGSEVENSNLEELKSKIGWNSYMLKQSSMRELSKSAPPSMLARIYLWWMLTGSLFVNKKKTHGHTSFLQLLDKPGEAGRYAWGAGALANLYRELGVASRNDCKQVSGCLTVLQAWIYAYFLDLRPQTRSSWTPNEPHASRWIPTKVTSKRAYEALLEHRHYLDGIDASSVEWTPFESAPGSVVPISMFRGIIHCRSICEPYMPDRVSRQFGFIQAIPMHPIQPLKAVRTTNSRKYKVQHDPMIWKFEQGTNNTTFQGWDTATMDSDCTPDYMDWYILRTHPRLMRDLGDYEVVRTLGKQPSNAEQYSEDDVSDDDVQD